MKKINLFFVLTLLCLCSSCVGIEKSPLLELQKTLNYLNEHTDYKYQLHVESQQMGRHLKDSVDCFLNFSPKDKITAIKYLFTSKKDDYHLNSDGSKVKTSLPNEETTLLNETPDEETHYSSTVLHHSPYIIKNLLNHALTDSAFHIIYLKDTLVNEKMASGYSIVSTNVSLLPNGEIRRMKGVQLNYELYVDKVEKYPVKFVITQAADNYFSAVFKNLSTANKIDFTALEKELFPEGNLELSQKEYDRRTRANFQTLVGETSPSFQLEDLTGKTYKIDENQKGPILLDFWFPACGACIISNPKINEIYETYRSQGLKIYGIEFSNSKTKYVQEYLAKHNVAYPNLINGKDVAKAFNVISGPTFILIDKNNKVTYFSSYGLNEKELIAKIKEVL